MKKRRILKRIVSIVLVMSMTIGSISVAPKQAQAFDLMGMFNYAGTFIRAGKTAMDQAQKKNWSPLKALGGTFKCIGKELLGMGDSGSPGSTVIVNQVDLSGVESQLKDIQNTLKTQNMTLVSLDKTMQSGVDSLSTQMSNIEKKLGEEEQRTRYFTYLNDYFNFYNQFYEIVMRSEKSLNTLYDGKVSDAVAKNVYDSLYSLVGTEYTGDFLSALGKMGAYLKGEIKGIECPGSVVDVLCRYYRLAGYSDTEIAAAVKDFVAQTYYVYCIANYYYMSIILFQTAYMEQSKIDQSGSEIDSETDSDNNFYVSDFGVKLGLEQIKDNFDEMSKNEIATTTRVFYDLNKHFCSLENMEVSYVGPAGVLPRKMNSSTMDVEPGSVVTLPDSTKLLSAYFGSDYVEMFGGVCEYSYESKDKGAVMTGERMQFDSSLKDGDVVNVTINCAIGDTKIPLHTYKFTGKQGELAGGYGTYEYPYTIKSEEQFIQFAYGNYNDSCISLGTDLDFKDKEFSYVYGDFTGRFYGNGHTISNAVSHQSGKAVGIFSKLSGAVVQDLIVKNADIQTGIYGETVCVGVIAGEASDKSRIERCEVIDSSSGASGDSGFSHIGGIVGRLSGSKLDGCMTRNVTVFAGESTKGGISGDAGSLAGYVTDNSTIKYCGRENGFVWSKCTGAESYTGGLIGQGHRSTMENSWSFMTSEGFTDSFEHSSYNHGSIIGYINGLKITSTYIYSGEDAKETNVNMIIYGTLRQGRVPEVSYVEDFTLSNLGFEDVGMLENADATGNPVRLAPVQMVVDTSAAKTKYYYGQDLIFNGLGVWLIRRGSYNYSPIPYEITTNYDSAVPGKYDVTVSSGSFRAGYEVLVAQKPHMYSYVKKDATCTEDGYIRYICQEEGCDEYIPEQVYPAKGHTMIHINGKEETCKEPGNKEYWHCLSCDKYFLDEEGKQESKVEDLEIPVNEKHTPVADDGDCTTPVKCDICGRIAIKAKAAHTWGAWTVEADGRHIRHCITAGCEKTEEKAGHVGKKTLTKASSKTSGRIVEKCTLCGKTLSTKIIPKIASVTLSSSEYVYSGNERKPLVIVKDSTGKRLSSSAYTVTYSAGRKHVGSYTVKVTYKGNYTGVSSRTFVIKPKNTSSLSVVPAKKQLTVKWAKQASQTTGYQFQYSTSSTFSNAKTVTIPKNTQVTSTIKNLSSGKKYYVRFRTYKKVTANKTTKTYYSAWSGTRSATTK